MNAWQVREAIQRRMTHGRGGCPDASSLGECAAVMQCIAPADAWLACLYLWPAGANLSTDDVAGWFRELACRDVVVTPVIDDPLNDIVDGVCTIDGARPWDVTFRLPETNP